MSPTDQRQAAGVQWALVGLGVLLRLRQYLFARAIWLDEAMLLNNVLGRSFAGLLRPLESDQTAPVPFMGAVKLAALLGGTDERVLRAVAFLGSVGLLVALLYLARRLLGPWTAALAVLLVALSPMLIYYANEVKPYGVDACWLAVTGVMVARLVEAPGDPRRRAALLLTGLVVALASSTAPFILAGAGLALVLVPEVRAARGGWPWLLAMGAVWGGAFGAEYLLVYRAASDSAYMQRFWTPYFLSPALPGLGAKLVDVTGEALQEWFFAPGGGWRRVAALGLALPVLCGAWAVRRRPWVLALLLVPPGAAVLASVVRAYPAAPRLLLFASPGIALLLAEGTAVITGWLGRRWPVAWLAAAAVALAFLPGLDAARQLLEPRQREETRPLVERLLREHQPGAAVYVYARAMPAWLFYTTDWSSPDQARLHHLLELVSSNGAAFRNAPTRGHAVTMEGDSLVFAGQSWRELVGVPTGTGPDALGVPRPQPDSGWADNEARRLHEAGGPEAWVLVSSFSAGVPDLLQAALERTGAVKDLREDRPGAVLMRWRWPVTAPAAPSAPGAAPA